MALNRRSPRRELRRVRVHASGQREKDGGVGAGAACARTQREGRVEESTQEKKKTEPGWLQPKRQGQRGKGGWRRMAPRQGAGAARSSRLGKARQRAWKTPVEERGEEVSL